MFMFNCNLQILEYVKIVFKIEFVISFKNQFGDFKVLYYIFKVKLQINIVFKDKLR